MNRLNDYLIALKGIVNEVNVQTAFGELSKGKLVVDIRENDEVRSGRPTNSVAITKGMIEMKIGQIAKDLDQPIYLMCQSGKRSLLAAKTLLDIGYQCVYSIEGGFTQWKNAGLPFEIPSLLSDDSKERYMRNMIIPEIGEKGQEKLLASKILVVGAGGIGSPLLYYLAAVGIGTIGIIDQDLVDKTNLQRQIIHSEANIGKPKVDSAKESLKSLNPTINIITYFNRLDAGNADDIIRQYDIIIDGTDNFTTRYLVNDACVKLRKPNIHGSVFMFEGQFTTFWPALQEKAPCYRCLFPSPPPSELAANCAEAGVLGVLPGIIGTLCATEAINIILGFENMATKLLVVNSKPIGFSQLNILRDPNCPYCNCTDFDHFPAYIDYATFCSV